MAHKIVLILLLMFAQAGVSSEMEKWWDKEGLKNMRAQQSRAKSVEASSAPPVLEEEIDGCADDLEYYSGKLELYPESEYYIYKYDQIMEECTEEEEEEE